MFCQAFKYELGVLIASTLTLVLMYVYLGNTNIPVITYSAAFSSSVTGQIAAGTWTDTSQPPPFAAWGSADVNNAASTLPGTDGTLSLRVTFPVYVMAMEGFVGWFFFVVFAGVGLSALPVDLICAFIYRPRHMDAIEFAEAQLSVRTRVNDLIEIGEVRRGEERSEGWSEATGKALYRSCIANNLPLATRLTLFAIRLAHRSSFVLRGLTTRGRAWVGTLEGGRTTRTGSR